MLAVETAVCRIHVAENMSIPRDDGEREGRARERVEDVVEAPVDGGDHHTPGDGDEQVREPTLVPPRDQAHDDRTRHVRARKRAAARAAAGRHLMNEIEEELAGERRAQALRQSSIGLSTGSRMKNR